MADNTHGKFFSVNDKAQSDMTNIGEGHPSILAVQNACYHVTLYLIMLHN